MSERQRLGVIFGGRSPEHEVSVVSARSILREADAERFEVVPFGITRGGAWLTAEETAHRLAGVERGDTDSLGDDESSGLFAHGPVIAELAALDVVFPIVHGPSGEDGALQGLLEHATLPYVGAGVGASAVGMDKAFMKAQFAASGIPQARYAVLPDSTDETPDETLRRIEHEIGYPCFVKPAGGGSSLGIRKARSREELSEAIGLAARYDAKVLVEEAIDGREVECAVLGNADPQASPLGEIRPHDEFYTYDSKYGDVGAELLVPAELPAPVTEQVQAIAIDAYRALDCAGLARVDCFVTQGEEIRVIELNTLPGFTPISMYPRLWEHAGVPYGELISRLVDLALERHDAARARSRRAAATEGRDDA